MFRVGDQPYTDLEESSAYRGTHARLDQAKFNASFTCGGQLLGAGSTLVFEKSA